MSDKKEILAYLYDLERFGIRLGLEAITKICETLGDPQKSFKSIHIAGTNGKGSTSAYIQNILIKAGYKTALYTSPHLIRFNERIRVNDELITDDEIIELVQEIKQKLEKADVHATFFEFTTAMAFLYFARKKVDVAVIEVGMGGRLDATNIINPELSIITPIGFDHAEHLGQNILQIAKEKAGIIKQGKPVVTFNNYPVLDLFKKICAEKNTKLLIVKDLLKAKIITSDHESNFENQTFRIKGMLEAEIKMISLGEYQVDNACTAIVAAKQLAKQGFDVSDENIINGIEETKWAGRIDVISRKPLIIVDGAHNPEAMVELKKFVQTIPKEKRKLLLIGIAKDKDIKCMIKTIAPLFKEIIVSKGNYKPAETTIIAEEARKYCADVIELPEIKQAIDYAKSRINNDGNELMLITGSLYLIGDAMKLL